MAEINPPLYLDQDDAYGAAELGLPFRDIVGEGVVGAGDLLVTAATGLNSSVATGAAWVAGDNDANAQPTYRVRNDAARTMAHNAADATNPRIDIVIAEVLDATFSGVSKLWRLRVVTGAPAASPAAPALPPNAIELAEVRVNAGSGSLTSVTDKRTRASIGGGAALVAAVSPLVVLVTDARLAADAVSWDVQNIPGNPGDVLEAQIAARFNSAGWLRFNADTGNTYVYEQAAIVGATSTPAVGTSDPASGIDLWPAVNNGGGATFAGVLSFWVPNYAGTDFYKGLDGIASAQHADASNNNKVGFFGGTWKNAAAVTRVTILDDGTPGTTTIKAGSRLGLWRKKIA